MKNNVRLQLLMSGRHRRMLERLAEHEGRSLNGMLRALIERAYETARTQTAEGRARGVGGAAGKSA